MDVTKNNRRYQRTMNVTGTISNENNGCSRVSHETEDETDIHETQKGETPMSHYESMRVDMSHKTMSHVRK